MILPPMILPVFVVHVPLVGSGGSFSVSDFSVFVSVAQAEEDRKIADRKMKWNEQQRRKDAKGLSLRSSRLRAFAVQSVPFDSCASVICGYRRDAKSARRLNCIGS